MPLYHPAVLFYREDLKEAMAADFRLLAELLANRQPADSAA
jgi:uracil-DNA glycosylase